VTDHLLIESAATAPRSTRREHILRRHDDLIEAPTGVGPHDHATIEEILALLPALTTWPDRADQYGARSRRLAGARAVLEWLQKYPGTGWQQRWKKSGSDNGMQWIDDWVLTATGSHDRHHSYLRGELVAGLGSLLLCRIVLPSCDFLAAYRAHSLYKQVQQELRPSHARRPMMPVTSIQKTRWRRLRQSPTSGLPTCESPQIRTSQLESRYFSAARQIRQQAGRTPLRLGGHPGIELPYGEHPRV
jgi:hypothetical protein